MAIQGSHLSVTEQYTFDRETQVNEETDTCSQLVRTNSSALSKPDSLSLEVLSKLVDCTSCIDTSLMSLG